MRPESLALLEHIRDSAAFVLDAAKPRSFAEYQSNRIVRQAIERNLEIIGEAMGRLAKLDPAAVGRITRYREIIAFRNLLIHGYQIVDDAIVWRVVEEHLPLLREEIQRLLAT